MSSPVRQLVTTIAAAGIAAVSVSSAAHAAAPASQSTPVMVVLDASGSMTASDAPGPRIVAAKQAVTGLVGSLPSDAQVGLEVYGTSTGSSNAEKAAGCKDIKVLVPVGPIDRSSFTSRVNSIKASGYTPIGESLRTAAANLPKEGPRSIVLVSDGEDTCAPPQPCAVAKELKKQGVDLVVDTVGFKVNAAARAQLVCIADVTGGTYVDATDGPGLGRQLRTRVQRALKPYAAVGTPIAGTPGPRGAPELKPGQYLDTYDVAGQGPGGDGTVKYYSVVLRKGDTPYVSATIVPSAARVEGLTTLGARIVFTGADGTGCTLYADGNGVAYRGQVDASTAVLSPGEVGGPEWPTNCPTEGAFALKISRIGNSYSRQPLKMEIALRIEPPADDSGLPPEASPQPNARAQSRSGLRNVTAGSSYNDAPLLQAGRYRDNVVSGETRYYKVHLKWGQRLAYLVQPAHLPGLGVGGGVIGRTRTASPLRAALNAADGAKIANVFVGGSTDTTMDGSTTVPVRYTNRHSADDEVQKYAVDGDYYLVFSADSPEGQPKLTIPYTLTLSVIGTAEKGPVYRKPANSSGSSSTASTPASALPASPSSPPVAGPGNGSKDGGVSAPVVVGGAAAGLLACAGAATLFLRRRRAPAGHAPTAPMDVWPPPGGGNR